MKRYGSDGDPDANGEFYLARDVGLLEDQLEDALRDLARTKAELECSRGDLVSAMKRNSYQAHQQFGYLVPEQARDFLSGKTSEVIVYRKLSANAVMPNYIIKGPSSFKLPMGHRPRVGARIYVQGRKASVIALSKRDERAVIAKIVGQVDHEETINWSLTNDAQAVARQGVDRDGSVAGQAD